MVSLVKVASSSNAIFGSDPSYLIARATASEINAYEPPIGQDPTFYISRVFLKFDTSSIDPDAVISAATLTLTPTYLPAGAPFDIDLVAQDWSAQDPLAIGNQEAAYDNCLSPTASSIWANSADLILDTPKTTAIATGIVAKGATTYISLRAATDKAATAPTLTELIYLWPFDAATPAHRPTLTVTYTVPPAGQGFARSPMWGHFRQDPRIVNVPFSPAGYHRANRRP